MTKEEFQKQNCKYCGSQRCLCDEDSIASCGYYKGDIEGIPKKTSIQELLKEVNNLHKKRGYNLWNRLLK